MTPSERRERLAGAFAILAPAAVAALVFAPTLHNGAVYDDPAALAMARAPLGEVLWHRFGLTYLSIRVDDIIGAGALPVFHLTNVVLHAACSALAALLALGLTGRPWVAFMTGALFAVHPAHVEVVASIENRKDMLAALFGMTSVLLYRSRLPFGYAASLVALLLALHAKDAAAIGLVGVLPLAGLLPRHDEDVPWAHRLGRTVRRLVPIAVVGIVASVLYGGNLAAKLRPDEIELTTAGACRRYRCVLGTSAAALPEVARLLVFPRRLSADHPTRPQHGLLTPAALSGVSVALALAAAGLMLTARSSVAAFAVAWIGITWLPVSNVVPLTAYFVAERYLYLPSFGACLLAALGLQWLLGRWRPALVGVAAVVLAAGAVRSRSRIRDWRDDLTLWTAALEAVPEGSARIHAELGRALSNTGHAAEAVPHLQTAVDLQPLRADGHSDLGLALLQSGRPSEAIPAFRRALDLWPENPLVQFNLAHALLDNGQRDEAVRLLRAVAADEAWRDLPAHQQAAVVARGMTPGEFQSRVRGWLAKNAPAP